MPRQKNKKEKAIYGYGKNVNIAEKIILKD